MKHEIDLLLVEDNPNDVELTLRALRSSPLADKIEVLRDGQELLDYLRGEGAYKDRSVSSFPPKIILLDLKLPRVTGLEAIKLLKSDPKTRAIPIVVLTSSQQKSDIVESYQLGVNSYLVKPVDFQRFTEVMEAFELYWLQLNKRLPQ